MASEQVFRLIAVADLDAHSRVDRKDSWKSTVITGILHRHRNETYSVQWTEPTPIFGGYALSGRGMELSELQYWDDKLYAFDDRTGIVFELNENTYDLYPRHIVADGDGNSPQGCKVEWTAVKDGMLFIGAAGKEWTSMDPNVPHSWNPVWVHTISNVGTVQHVNWTSQYGQLRHALKADFPHGYAIHEAAAWSVHHKRWFWLPRRVSGHAFTPSDSLRSGSNVLMHCTEDFTDVTVVPVGLRTPSRGYSSMKFVPGSGDMHIVALKTEESEEEYRSYITVFSISGKVLLEEQLFSTESKFEGIEVRFSTPTEAAQVLSGKR